MLPSATINIGNKIFTMYIY